MAQNIFLNWQSYVNGTLESVDVPLTTTRVLSTYIYICVHTDAMDNMHSTCQEKDEWLFIKYLYIFTWENFYIYIPRFTIVAREMLK